MRVCNASSMVLLTGAYTQLAAITLQLNLGSNGAGRLNVAGIAAVDGTLSLNFKAGMVPKVGDTFTVMRSGALIGRFASVVAPGFKVTPTCTGTQLVVRIDG